MTRRSSITVLPPWPAFVAPLVRWIIYALIDPRYNTVRYIGLSSRGLDRPREHAKLAAKGHGAHDLRHCYNWIRLLQRLELAYEIVVLEEVDVARWPKARRARVTVVKPLKARERWWIKFARAWGCDLTNLTDGGDGALGFHPTSVTRARHRAAWANPEVKARRRAGMIAAFARPEVKARKRVSAIAANARPEVKARISAASRAAQACPEVKARQRVGLIAALARPEVKARQRAGLIAANARPEVKARIRAGLIAANARPEVKARQRAGLVAALARPEVKARQCAASRVVAARPGESARRSARARATHERVGHIQAATYRRLIAALPDATNKQIHAAAVAKLGADQAGPLKYAAQYRRQLRCESSSLDAREAMNARRAVLATQRGPL